MNLMHHLGTGIVAGVVALSVYGANPETANDGADMSNRKQQVVDLLKSLETGDPKSLQYINPNKYIQHNLAVGDG